MQNKVLCWILLIFLILSGCLAEQPLPGEIGESPQPTIFQVLPTEPSLESETLQPTSTTQENFSPLEETQSATATSLGMDSSSPPAIILFIGDGMGGVQRIAATWLLHGEGGSLAMDTMPVKGSAMTASANNPVTDSAAAATAMATGRLTRNKYLGVDPEKNILISILELAQREGWAVGLVTTVPLTHATPAAFAAHLPNRTDTTEIARQMMGKEIEVLLGGGEDDFYGRDEEGCFPGWGKQPAGMGLISSAVEKGYQVVCYRQELLGIDSTQTDRLVGFFSAKQIVAPFSPDLAEMTQVAMDILSKDPDGFFLLVEAGQIDWAGHDNDARAAMEFTLGLDKAVSLAQTFAQDNENTLIIVTADHETGGMQLNRDGAGSFRQDGPFSMPDGSAFWVDWGTGGHTSVSVPVTAQGPFSENLAGEHPLTKIFETMTLHLFNASQ